MADFEVTVQAKLDESSLGAIKQQIKSLENELKNLKIEPQVNAKAIANLESQIKTLQQKVVKIELNLDTSKATSAMNDVANSAGKAGQQAGQNMGKGLESSLQSSLNSIKKNISNTIASFGDSKMRTVDIADKFGLNRNDSKSISGLESVRSIIKEISGYEKEILNPKSSSSADQAWQKINESARQLKEVLMETGRSKVDKSLYSESLGIADYFQGEKIFAGSSKDEIFANTGRSIQELNREFKSLGVTFTTSMKDATQLDTVWDELFSISPGLKDVSNYYDQLNQVVNLLKTAKDVKFGEKGFTDINEREVNDYILDYVQSLDNADRRLQVYRTEQVGIEQAIAEQAKEAADSVVQNEERKQQAYQDSANASKQSQQSTSSSTDAVVEDEQRKRDAIEETSKALQDAQNRANSNNGFTSGMKDAAKGFSDAEQSMIDNFKKSLSGAGLGEKDIDRLTNRIKKMKEELNVQLTSLSQSESLVSKKDGLQSILSIDVAGIDKYGQAIKLTEQWDQENHSLIKSLDEVSTAQQKAGSSLGAFDKQKKNSVANLTNQINQLNKSATDKNASRPIVEEEHLNSLTTKYNEIVEAIGKVKNASTETFTDEQNNVKTLISDYKSLVSEYRNAENVATKMKGTNFSAGKDIAKNNLEAFRAEAQNFTQMKKTIGDLDTKFGGVIDAASLNEFNDQLRVARSELARVKVETKNPIRVFNTQDLKNANIPYMTKMYSTVEDQMQEIQKMANAKKWDIIDVSGVEKAEGKIKQLTLTIQDAEGVVKKLQMSRADISTGKKTYNGLVQIGDTSILKTSEEATKQLNDQLLSSYQKIQDMKIKMAGLDTSKDVQQIQLLEHEITNLQTEYDTAYQSAQQKKFFDSSGFEQQKAAIDAETKFRIDNIGATKESIATYKELYDIANQISNLKVSNFKLDPVLNEGQIKSQEEELKTLSKTFDDMFSKNATKLSPNQLGGLSDVFENTQAQLDNLRASFKDKIDIAVNDGNIENMLKGATDKVKNLGDEYKTLKQNVSDASANFNTMKDTSNDIDQRIEAYRRLNSILPSVKDGMKALTADETAKTQEAQTDLDNLIKKYQEMANLTVKKATIDPSQDINAIQQIEQAIQTLQNDYDALYEKASTNTFFDKGALDLKKSQIDVDTSNQIQQINNVKEITAAYEQLRDIANQVGNTEIKLFSLDPSKNSSEIESLTTKLEQLKTKYDDTYSSLTGKGLDLTPAQFADLGTILENTEQKISALRDKLKDKMELAIDSGKLETQLSTVETKMQRMSEVSDEVKSKAQDLRTAFETMTNPDASIDDKIAAFQQFNAILPSVQNELNRLGQQYKLTADQQNVLTRSSTLSNNILTWMNNNTKAAEKYGDALRQLRTELDNNTDAKVQQRANAQFQNIKSQAKAEGLVSSGMLGQLKNTALYMAGFGSMFQGINTMVRGIKNGVSSITALDTALVDLKKTAQMTSEQLDDFYLSSNDVAKEMGVSTEDIINQASAWSRLGYSTNEQATQMAKYAAMFAKISPGMSLDDATDGLVSVMKAFKIGEEDVSEVVDGIMSKINIIGKQKLPKSYSNVWLSR